MLINFYATSTEDHEGGVSQHFFMQVLLSLKYLVGLLSHCWPVESSPIIFCETAWFISLLSHWWQAEITPFLQKKYCPALDIDCLWGSKVYSIYIRNRANCFQTYRIWLTVALCFSYVEIYNERPRDLLLSSKTEKVSLKVREHPKNGPYVQGLYTKFVCYIEMCWLQSLCSHWVIGNIDQNCSIAAEKFHCTMSGKFEPSEKCSLHVFRVLETEHVTM